MPPSNEGLPVPTTDLVNYRLGELKNQLEQVLTKVGETNEAIVEIKDAATARHQALEVRVVTLEGRISVLWGAAAALLSLCITALLKAWGAV